MSEHESADTTAHEAESTAEAVDQTVENPETEEPESSDAEQADEEKKRQASERTRRRREQRMKAAARREREARIEAEKLAEYYRGLAEARMAADGKPENAKPEVDDFDTYDEYLDAMVDWKLAQAGKQDVEQAGAADPTPSNDTPPEPPKEFEAFREAGIKKYGEDFEEMMEAARNQEFAASQLMVEAMLAEEVGPDMAMHFYDNPEEALRISQLPPLRQAMELNKVAETLKSQPEKKISQAPEPIKPEKGASVRDVDLSKLDTDEYIRRRRKMLYGG